MNKTLVYTVYLTLFSSLCSIILMGTDIYQSNQRSQLARAERARLIQDTEQINAKLDSIQNTGDARGVSQQETAAIVKQMQLLLTNIEGKLDE